MKHPNQPIELAEDGYIRFKKNKIVKKMLEFCTERGYSLNEIRVDFYDDNDDYVQLMQLIGYSVSGYGDLSCVSKKECRRADRIAEKLAKKKE